MKKLYNFFTWFILTPTGQVIPRFSIHTISVWFIHACIVRLGGYWIKLPLMPTGSSTLPPRSKLPSEKDKQAAVIGANSWATCERVYKWIYDDDIYFLFSVVTSSWEKFSTKKENS